MIFHRSIIAALVMTFATAGSARAQELEPVQVPPWMDVFERLTLFGDFRYRAESDWNRVSGEDRFRSRLRARLGANYSVTDDLLAGARLTTGPKDDPRDSNFTLGDGFSKIDIHLDRLFLTWHADDQDPTFVTLGKFAHPFHRNPIFDELVWYSDVQPEGIVLGKTGSDIGPLDSLRAQAGYYVVQEDSMGDAAVGVAELLARSRLSPDASLDVSLAYYGYSSVDAALAGTNMDFEILDAIAVVAWGDDRAPWKFAAEGISNLGASGSDATGWALGISRGSTRRAGDWRAYYQYQEVGQDAVFGPVAGADTLLEKNFRGHVVNIDHVLTEKASLRLRTLIATPIDSSYLGGFDETTYRVRLDLNVKF